MSYPDVMLDLETLDTGVNAAILSIGAVAFNKDARETVRDMLFGHPERRFEIHVDLDGQLNLGRTISASTFYWWIKQSPAACARIATADKYQLWTALEEFKKWAGRLGADRLWGNGAAFDNAILRSAYNACKIQHPFTYRQDYCYRTIYGLHRGRLPEEHSMEGQELLVPHVAVHDAIYQACIMQRIL